MSSGIFNKITGYHNRRSIRLSGHDYSQPGYYFVTICIHDRKERLFGDIIEHKLILNEYGKCVEQCWREIPIHFPNVSIDEFIVMPNHVHGIIKIDHYPAAGVNNDSPLRRRGDNYSSQQIKKPCGTSKTIGSIVRGFKIGVTKLIHEQLPDFVVWQRNYYDQIIRDEKALFFIRRYIKENPYKWGRDKEKHIKNENEIKIINECNW